MRGYDHCNKHPTLGPKYGLNWNDAVSSFALTWGIWYNGSRGDQSSEHDESIYIAMSDEIKKYDIDVEDISRAMADGYHFVGDMEIRHH